MRNLIAISLVAVFSVSACSPQYGPGQGVAGSGYSKSQVGSVLGGVGGGLAAQGIGKGSGNTLAIAGGAILGSLLGSELGSSLDKADRQIASSSTQTALEQTSSGYKTDWVNPDSGNSGSITPTKYYKNTNGQHCREFSQQVTVSGQTQDAYGTACRQADGAWRIVGN